MGDGFQECVDTFSIVFGVCYRNRKAIFGWIRKYQKNAIVALCSYEGFISEDHHNLKLEHHAERVFLTLTNGDCAQFERAVHSHFLEVCKRR